MTKTQLVGEVNSLRARVAELERGQNGSPADSRLHDIHQFYLEAPVGLCLLDVDLRYVHINEMLARINGLPVSEHIGRTLREVIPEIADIVEPIYRRIIETGEPQLDIRVIGKTRAKTDVDRHYMVSYIPYRSEQGDIVGVSSFVRDITEQTLAEQSTAKAQEQLRDVLNSVELLNAIVEGTTDAIYVKTIEGRYLLVNSSCAQVMGKTPNEILGKDDTEIFPRQTAETLMEADRRIIAEGEPQFVEEVVTSVGLQSPRTYQSLKAPVHDSDGNVLGLFGISRDVTDGKMAEEQVQQLTADLQHAMRLSTMGEMAAGIAHEIHQPLAAITNYANGSRLRLEEDSANVPVELLIESMQKITSAGLCAGEIIERIKSFITKGVIETRPLDINEPVRDALELARPAIRKGESIVDVRLTEKLPSVSADRIQLIQVALNLIKNGIEAMAHMERQNRKLSVRTFADADQRVCVEVTDSGAGVPEHDRETVFDQFVTSKQGGMGMGLSISRTIIAAHRGTIWCGLNSDGASMFCFALPATGNQRDSNGSTRP